MEGMLSVRERRDGRLVMVAAAGTGDGGCSESLCSAIVDNGWGKGEPLDMRTQSPFALRSYGISGMPGRSKSSSEPERTGDGEPRSGILMGLLLDPSNNEMRDMAGVCAELKVSIKRVRAKAMCEY